MKLTPKVIFYMVLDVFVLIIGFAVPWYRFSVSMLNFEASTSLFLIPFRISNLVGFLENDVFSLLNVDASPLIAGVRFFQVVSVLPAAIIILIIIAFVFLFGKKDKKTFYLLSNIAMGVVLLTSFVGLIINHSVGQGIREMLSGLDSLGLGSVSTNVFNVGFGAGFYLLAITALVLLLMPLLFKHFGEGLPPALAAIGTDDDMDSAESSNPEHASVSADDNVPEQSSDDVRTSQQEKANLRARQPEAPFADEEEIASLTGDDGTAFSIRRLPFTIGRDIDHVDGLLSQPFISRQHCRFERQNESISLVDLNSTHGTFINHEQLPPNEQFYVLSGDVITVGKIDMTLSVRDPSDSSSTSDNVSDNVQNATENNESPYDEDDDDVTRFQMNTRNDVDVEDDDDDELTVVQIVREPSASETSDAMDETASPTAGHDQSLSDASEELDDELTTLQTAPESTLIEASDAVAEDERKAPLSAPAESTIDESNEEFDPPEDQSLREKQDSSSSDYASAREHSGDSTFKINFADRRCLVCITPDVDEAPCVITACPFRIGRNGDEVDFVIDSGSVSRIHLMITKDERTYYATDLHASNRVKINGNPISPGIEVPIEIGDVITIGNREYCFEKV